MDIIAYTDRLSARPGELIQFYVSTRCSTYEVAIIRHDHFFDTPDPARDTIIPSHLNKRHDGRHQPIATGSYTLVDAASALAGG